MSLLNLTTSQSLVNPSISGDKATQDPGLVRTTKHSTPSDNPALSGAKTLSDAERLAGFRGQMRYFYGDEPGYFPIDAGVADDEASTGILMLLPSEDKPDTPNKRVWCYYDPARPDLLEAAAAVALRQVKEHGNAYITRTLFERKRATKDSAKPSRIIAVEDAPAELPLPASRVLRTSPGSRQAFYRLTESVSTKRAERLTRLIARVVGADRSGTNANKVLRLVGGLNTKKKYGEPFLVRVESRDRDYTYEELWQAYSAYLPDDEAAARETEEKDRAAVRWPEEKEWWVDYWQKHLSELMDGKMPRVFKLHPTSQGYRIFGDDEYIAGWKHESGSWDASTVRWVRVHNLIRAGCTDEMAAAIVESVEHTETLRRKGLNAVRNDIRQVVTEAREKYGYERVGAFARKRQPEYTTPAEGQTDEARHVGGRPAKLTADRLLDFYRDEAASGVVLMTRAEVAEALHVSPETIYRLNSELKTRGEITVEHTAGRQRSIVRLTRLVKTSTPESVVTTRDDEPAERAETPQTANDAPQAVVVTHVVLSPAGGDAGARKPEPVLHTTARNRPAPPLAYCIREAIRAMEQQAVDPATGESWRGRATPDRIRAWLSERYPGIDTTEVEQMYPDVRKAIAKERQQAKDRAMWAAERQRVNGLADDGLLVALNAWAKRMAAAEKKRPGSPYAKRCAAMFAIHDDTRRRRGLALSDAPPGPRDRASRKAATERVVKVAQVLNRPPGRMNGEAPSQRSFTSVAEDVDWLPTFAAKEKRRQRKADQEEQQHVRSSPPALEAPPAPLPTTRDGLWDLLEAESAARGVAMTAETLTLEEMAERIEQLRQVTISA